MIATLLILVAPVVVSAFGGLGNTPTPTSNTTTNTTKIVNPLEGAGINSVQGFIEVLLKRVIQIAFPVIALSIIYCGFLFVMAQGNPSEIEKAKSALLYTLIGAALLLGAWALAQLIASTVTSLG